jgi:hypothetical protein
MSMKNSNDTIGNRSRDIPVCSAVPQPLRHQQRAAVFALYDTQIIRTNPVGTYILFLNSDFPVDNF